MKFTDIVYIGDELQVVATSLQIQVRKGIPFKVPETLAVELLKQTGVYARPNTPESAKAQAFAAEYFADGADLARAKRAKELEAATVKEPKKKAEKPTESKE